MTLPIAEADVKRAVEDYLLILENQGKLWFERLNTGSFFVGEGGSSRRIRGCRTGTADFIIVVKPRWQIDPIRVIFIETKRPKGKGARESQLEFKAKVEAVGMLWYLARTVEEVEWLLRE